MASPKTKRKRLAKKKLEKRRAIKERTSRIVEKQFSDLEEDIKQFAIDRKIELRRNVPGQEKMSEVLLDFLRPYLDEADTREAFERLIVIGIFAWNSAIASSDDMFNEGSKLFTENLSMLDRIKFKRAVKELIERKKKLYPNNRRMIMSYKIADMGDNWRVSVASTLGHDPGDQDDG